MTRLRRVRLDGIGPTGARFDPVTIDLTDRAGEAARVALIHLENGGGKSVLLKLIFSAVLPGRRNTLGGAKLGDFVLAEDTGHVALEWGIDDGHGGEAVLITGTVLEWRNKAKSSDQSNLRQWWYAFRPVANVLDLDTLPTRVDGRRPSRAAFRDRLVDTWHAAPALELADNDGPDRWRDWLLSHTPIDPELFAYQRAMNADESDAEELFSNVRNGDEFVRMLLRAVMDPAEMRSFGDTLGTFAAQLSRRDTLERERAFTVDAVAALGPLADAGEATIRAAEAFMTARRDGWTLRDSIAGEANRSTVEANRLAGAAAVDEQQAAELDSVGDRLIAQGQELRRREALFGVADANNRLEEAKTRAAAAANTAHAWKMVETVIDETTAADDRQRLQRELQDADVQDAPLRDARDQAAAALCARLDAEIGMTTADAEKEDSAVKAATDRRRAAGNRRKEAEGEASRLRADSNANDNRISEVHQARANLLTKGVLEVSESAADAEVRWTTSALETETDLAQRTTRLNAIQGMQRSLRAENENQAATLVRIQPKLTATQQDHERLTILASELANEDRLAEVVGAANVDLWARADHITVGLADAIVGAERDLRELTVATRADELALDALGESGLLPPSPDVAAVWEVFTAARIPATSGWRWLAERDDPEERARLLAGHPALAGGVVVTDPTRVDEAREIATAAGLDLRTIVAVGSAADLDADSQPVWTAPVHRGLYDEAWAADERVRIEQRLADAAASRLALELQTSADRALQSRLLQLFAQCPAGHLHVLVEMIAALSNQVNAATERRTQIAGELTTLEDEKVHLEGIVTNLRLHLESAMRNAGLCEEQARRDAAAEAWRNEALLWRAQAKELDNDAAAASLEADQAVFDGDGARDRAAALRRIATAHGSERDTLPVVAIVAAPDEALSTAVLRQQYRAASGRLESESSGKSLATDLSIAEALETDATRRLSREPADVISLARTLVVNPASGDPAARSEAQTRASAESERLDGLATDVAGDLRVAEAELQSRSPRGRARWADLPDDLEPRDRIHARELDRRVSDEQTNVAEQARLLHSKAASAGRAVETALSRSNVLAAYQQTLTVDDTPVETVGVKLFDGSIEEAGRLVADLSARYRQASADQALAAEALTAAIESVRIVGLRPQYSSIGGAQTALAEESPTTLASRASELAKGLDNIRASIDAELADVNKHRDGLIERLSTLVEQYLKLLKLAQRRSVIPDGLGEWRDKSFITINFQAPDADTFSVRMGAVIDAAVETSGRDATAIVLDAVRAAVVRRTAEGERAFSVTIMKPNAAMFDTSVDVERLSSEFSGGQRLTAAILLYCTLASLRAYVRGQERVADPGVLFLDNPIGKASADYLLDLQIAVAERHGVQLVYTTGISDPEVHASFNTIARLRNDADLRRHLNYIVVDDDLADRLADGRSLNDASGYLSATRLASLPRS